MRSSDPPVTLADWRDPPSNRWAFHHVSQIVPSAMIWAGKDTGPCWPEDTLDVAGVAFDWNGGRMTVADMNDRTCTDAFIVLREGKLVHESYYVGMQPQMPHILFSVTKSVMGLLAGILEGRGKFDIERTVGDCLPDMQASGYGDATVRHVLDMTVGIGFQEDYESPTGDMVRYREASGWNVGDPRDAIGLRRYLASLPPAGPHGEIFKYSSPNTDLLGMLRRSAAWASTARPSTSIGRARPCSPNTRRNPSLWISSSRRCSGRRSRRSLERSDDRKLPGWALMVQKNLSP